MTPLRPGMPTHRIAWLPGSSARGDEEDSTGGKTPNEKIVTGNQIQIRLGASAKEGHRFADFELIITLFGSTSGKL